MHHYPFHVGDYIRATAHLDMIEDCIYRRLIDLYMETELPIPNETQQVIRRLRLGSSGLILDTILQEFFTLESDNCWHNSRCDAEISEYKRLADISRINGKLGGRPKKTQQDISGIPKKTQQVTTKNQEPITNNQDIKTNVPSKLVDDCPHEKIIELYHSTLPTMPSVKVWTEKRRKLLQARWREDNQRQDVGYWERFFGYVAKSDFLCGRTDKPFNCDLEWMLNASNFVKIIEGKYHAG